MVTQLLGGIGLFLLGMVLLTDGLRAAAGAALRDLLGRVTGRTTRALLAGIAVTAVLQSSTATVLMTIGFVSAGLIGFRGAIGIVFGANLGTTSTGWLVALLGLKLSIGTVALPAVGVGALLRLLGRGRSAAAGLALAGFGLIFAGIDLLQEGMQALSAHVEPGRFPAGTLTDRLLLVGVGVAITVIMQSSSAAVATTLTALHSGAIGVEQAAALVVGQNIGTTVTAAIAAIGASIAARRTALAHVLFNVLTGTLAFFLIAPLLRLEAVLWPGDGAPDPALLVAAFHTVFNLLGLLALLPLAGIFAALITRLVPDTGPDFTRRLDPTVARVPAVAQEVARRTVMHVGAALLDAMRQRLERGEAAARITGTLDRADAALGDVRRFISRAATADGSDPTQFVSVLHAIEHFDRLIERLRAPPPAAAMSVDYASVSQRVRTALLAPAEWLLSGEPPSPAETCADLSRDVATHRRDQRQSELHAAAAGRLDPDRALVHLDAMRWLDSATYHVWRAVHHLAAYRADTQTELHD